MKKLLLFLIISLFGQNVICAEKPKFFNASVYKNDQYADLAYKIYISGCHRLGKFKKEYIMHEDFKFQNLIISILKEFELKTVGTIYLMYEYNTKKKLVSRNTFKFDNFSTALCYAYDSMLEKYYSCTDNAVKLGKVPNEKELNDLVEDFRRDVRLIIFRYFGESVRLRPILPLPSKL